MNWQPLCELPTTRRAHRAPSSASHRNAATYRSDSVPKARAWPPARAGTLCLARTEVPDSVKESGYSAYTMLLAQTVWAQESSLTS